MGSHVDQLARLLHRGGPRRWALKTLTAGALGVGMMTRGARSSQAQADERFQKCLRSCLASCNAAPDSCTLWGVREDGVTSLGTPSDTCTENCRVSIAIEEGSKDIGSGPIDIPNVVTPLP